MWRLSLVLFCLVLFVHANSVHIEKIHENFISSKDTYIFDQQNRLKQVNIVATSENAEITYVKQLFSSTFGKDHMQEFFCAEKDVCLSLFFKIWFPPFFYSLILVYKKETQNWNYHHCLLFIFKELSPLNGKHLLPLL